ncbi:hypothetical protein BaRGS_00027562 [Batillaria attramentaria]|uniref:Uncharacterized protein n=1 Tax=Batillaria attramentaria TaxID=370345 RepID=A0ABD0K2J8_9CAEN
MSPRRAFGAASKSGLEQAHKPSLAMTYWAVCQRRRRERMKQNPQLLTNYRERQRLYNARYRRKLKGKASETDDYE